MKTLTTVQGIYEAFGRGDVAAILERIHEDVDWEYGAAPNDVPWLARRRGRQGARAFFETLAAELEFRAFEVLEMVGNDRLVVAVCRLEALVKRTGKTLREEAEAHLWHFDADGRIVKFRHAADTFAHAQAWTPR